MGVVSCAPDGIDSTVKLEISGIIESIGCVCKIMCLHKIDHQIPNLTSSINTACM